MATNEEIISFIKTLGSLAVAECNNRIAQGKPFILPSVCIAQAAHETGWGQSGLMDKANAFFGIKAGGSWTGKIFVANTWEVAPNGEAYNTVANFRAYDSLADSVADYYQLTTGASRYSKALCYGTDPSKWLTPKEVVTALWQGGYATDNLYVEKVMNFINPRKLYEWDAKITGVADYSYLVNDLTFNKSSLVQGSLMIFDSGRSITNNNAVTNAVALNWSNSVVIEGNGTLTISLPETYSNLKVYIARVRENVATIEGPLSPGDTFEVVKDDRIGYYLETDTNIPLSPDILIDEYNLTLKVSSMPDNNESYPSELAFFVKIE